MAASVPATTYSCTNMTFEEAYAILSSGENLNIVLMKVVNSIPYNIPYVAILASSTEIVILSSMDNTVCIWTASGIVEESSSVN